MTEKKPSISAFGYFKIEVPKSSIFQPGQKLLKSPKSQFLGRKRIRNSSLLVPVIGLTLAILFLAGVQTGLLFANKVLDDFAVETSITPNLLSQTHPPLTDITLPASVSFLLPVYSQAVEWLKPWGQKFLSLWVNIFNDAARFFSPRTTPAEVSPELIAQLKQEILADLGQTATTSDQRFSLLAIPSTGSSTQDELIRLNLQRMFSDEIDVQFNEDGSSGIITPIFRDGRRGGDYVFILTPLK